MVLALCVSLFEALQTAQAGREASSLQYIAQLLVLEQQQRLKT